MSSKQWCAGVVLALVGATSADAASYLVLGRTGSNAQTLQKQIEAVPGGTLQRALPGLLTFAVQSDDAAYPARLRALPGVQYVAPDRSFTLGEPRQVPLAGDAAEAAAQMQRALAGGAPRALSGAVDQGLLAGNALYQMQWAVQDVQAPGAWNRGYSGAGVRVAILDSGIDCGNAWLAPNIDFAAAASLVPGEGVCVQPGFYFNHGTHVAGIVAALPSSFGSVGIAPGATLIPVKVLSEYTGSGAFSWVLG
ncbi:nattokinase, partial [mine drainage metagenome]